MLAAFKQYLQSRTNLTDLDIERIASRAIQKVLKRNECLFIEEEVCRHKAFVVTGLLRIFGKTEDDNEHIIQFSPENTWALDAESYDQQIPSRYNLGAVEESEVLMWAKKDFDQLLKDIPGLKMFSDQLIQKSNHTTRQRLLSALSKSPEEKYNDFVVDSPDLLKRLPLKMIAGYLGISIKTLTRLRHAQLHG